MSIVTGDTEFFKGIGQIKYEGLGSDNPLAFAGMMQIRLWPAKP